MYKGLDLTRITVFDLPDLDLNSELIKHFMLIQTFDEAKKGRLSTYKKHPSERAFDLLRYAESIKDEEFFKKIEEDCADEFDKFFDL